MGRGGRYTMGRGVNIPWVGGSKYHLSKKKEFRIFLIGIFSTLPQSEYTSCEVYSVKTFEKFENLKIIKKKNFNFKNFINFQNIPKFHKISKFSSISK
jgi:hypothetical protein